MIDNQKVEEYKEIGQNLRHYSQMRFWQLTLFTVVTGTLFGYQARVGHEHDALLAAAGIFVTIFFWILEERAADNWFDLLKRAKEIENNTEWKQYSTRRSRKIFSATNATRGILILVFVYWLYLLLSYFC